MDQVIYNIPFDNSIPLGSMPMSTGARRSTPQPSDFEIHHTVHRHDTSRSYKRKRPTQCRAKRIRNTSIVAAISAAILLIIGESTAFVFISPTQSQTLNKNPTENTHDTHLFFPHYIYHPERIKKRSTLLVFRATAEDNNDNKPNRSNKKRPNNTNSKKTGKSNVPKNSKGNFKNSKKGKGANKNAKSKKPLDPSKQKKKEILDTIKAKIKEEGEEKRRKQSSNKNNSNKKKQSNTKPKNNPKRKNDQQLSQPTQARLQKLADEDPSESQFDNDEDPTQADESNEKRQRLFMNPFEAGKTFRQTLQNLSTLGRGLQLPKETKQKYFVDDRLLDGDDEPGSRNAGAYFSDSPLLQSNFNSKSANSLLQEYARAEALDPIEDYIPEVLVVGATGEIGRLVVRRLLLEGRGRFRVRVLVRDLYSQTLNLLGTGVSYCQGDLNDVESLEYSLTDVDKIVYVAGAPKPDETDFQRKFQLYLEENDLKLDSNKLGNKPLNDLEWEQLASVLEVRSELAEQVDCVGMKNLVSAYQNVRHTDYGTSQAAKRSLFKFNKNSGDFDLFALDDGDDDEDEEDDEEEDTVDEKYDYEDNSSYEEETYNDDSYGTNYNYDDNGEYDEDKYEDVYGNYDEEMENYGLELESRKSKDTNVVKAQVKWLKNKFNRGVFVGRVPKADASNPVANPGGEASIIVSRLRSREEPEMGIDMSGFAGFILRLVSDGNNYEAFVRTELYETDGIEYVYEFSTESKATSPDNYSNKRFKTVRLAFENFKPIQRRKLSKQDEDDNNDVTTVPPFDGSDVRYLGFRFRSSSNVAEQSEMQEKLARFSKRNKDQKEGYQRFYMALTYIKVYRAQPEPEFIYLSDARIPPVIRDGMVHHERKMLITNDDLDQEQQSESGKENSSSDAATLLDEKDLQRKSMLERSPEETYFKYRGEEILIKSGLSYTIIRVAGFNELSGSEASTIDLVQSNAETKIVPVSRAEVAQVCVSALLDPSALNKCVYMTKKSVAGKNVLDEEDISAKFEGIPTDIIM